VSDGTDCTCDLLDVTELAGPKYVRGFSRGCPVHPPTEWERKKLAEFDEWVALDKDARKAAREAP
jgi:hypothetical protein